MNSLYYGNFYFSFLVSIICVQEKRHGDVTNYGTRVCRHFNMTTGEI